MAYRLGVDVGGTFTDLLLINEDTGETFRAKVPTTPVNQAAAVLDGIERVCAIAGIEPAALSELMHGTTVATNAVLEGKGALVGLIVTDGYRQVLQIGALVRAGRPCRMDHLAEARAARHAREHGRGEGAHRRARRGRARSSMRRACARALKASRRARASRRSPYR